MRTWLFLLATSLISLSNCSPERVDKDFSDESAAVSPSPVCTPIPRPETEEGGPVYEGRTADEKLRTRAEACLHRAAYQLGKSPDDADDVSRAAVEQCRADINSVMLELKASVIRGMIRAGDTSGAVETANGIERQARSDLQQFALLKVVEGRAGKCKG